ncbi:MAG: hypothetical protein EOM64_02050 [Erysipelotrichia bacterium]|nr:hypothetical protein [Erysipelotrichia bacterium]
MKVYINAANRVRIWPRVEKYQNTTLRYSPGEDFSSFLESDIGRLHIIRLFITLDEVWDYRTDTYHWDYLIGVNNYQDDPKHYAYDWPLTVPSVTGTHELPYLTSHAACADRVLLNIRRYEREVTDGTVSIEKYQEVLKNVLDHYKRIIPNITYIEVCNEVELEQFGGLTMPEYYRLYKAAASVVSKLNQEHAYTEPLQVGGFGMACGMWHISMWREFLQLLEQDQNRRIDFYSFHEYHTNPYRVMELYMRHMEMIREFNLPDLPIFLSEYGMRNGLGDAGRPTCMQNASGEIPGFVIGSHCHNLYIFPWCTFHNPNQQIGRTMYIQTEDGKYAPTPNGHVMKFFSMLGKYECENEYYNENRSVASIDNDHSVSVLISNPQDTRECYHVRIHGISSHSYRIVLTLVDSEHNNILTSKVQKNLVPEEDYVQQISDAYSKDIWLSPYSFCFLQLIPAE